MSRATNPACRRSATAPAVEPLEQRQYLATSPVFAGTKIKGINLSANGISTNQTLITIPFTGNIQIVDPTMIQLRGYAINPLSPTLGQVKKTVGVVDIHVLDSDHRYLQITTDRLMRKGGNIFLYAGGLADDNGDMLAEQTLKTLKGQNKERFTLANRAFLPTLLNRFTPDIYSAAPTPTDASSAIPEATVTSQLTAFLDAKVTLGIITTTQRDDALANYNDTTTGKIVPDANLRAAMISLTGTFAESAIASYLNGSNLTGSPYTIVTFQTPTDATAPVAQTTVRPSDGHLRTVIRPEFQGEPFQVLSAWLAHEALHQDTETSLQEEEFANIVATLIYAQQGQADTSFLKTGTALVNLENDKLYAMLNSGRALFPYIGDKSGPILGAANGVFPGQNTVSGGVYTSYDDYVRRIYLARGAVSGTSAGNALLNTYYTNITAKTVPQGGVTFNDTIINDVDLFQAPLGTKLAIRLAAALGLGLS